MKDITAEFERIVREAGALAMKMRAELNVKRKLDGSVVTQADLAVEKYLRERLTELVPGSMFLGEESFAPKIDPEAYVWIVDPIDGTDSYRQGLAYFGISIALTKGRDLVQAIFFNPMLDEMYQAQHGKGATLNGEPIQVAADTELDELSLALGPSNFHIFYRLSLPIKMRSLGSTAHHLALVADGRACCAFFQPFVWDVAAGMLILQEAGGEVRFLDGSDFHPSDYLNAAIIPQPILAATPALWETMALNIKWRKRN